MRALLIGAAALLLAACATPAPTPTAQPLQATAAARQPIVVATLATNPCEAQVAPAYTQAITLVQQTRARLAAGTVTPAVAQRVVDVGQTALEHLDAACPNRTLDPPRLAAARQAIAQMQSLLGG